MKRMKRKAANRETDSIKGTRRGLAQAKKGLGRSIEEVFEALELNTAHTFVAGAACRILERSEW